mgnify:CR=1 FL=1
MGACKGCQFYEEIWIYILGFQPKVFQEWVGFQSWRILTTFILPIVCIRCLLQIILLSPTVSVPKSTQTVSRSLTVPADEPVTEIRELW